MPRPIHDKVAYANAVEIIDALAGHKLSKDQEDYLEAMALFVREYEKRFMHKDGTPVWVQVNAALVRDELDLPVQLICQVLDVTARRDAEQRVKALALHDALTGLPNTRLLEDRLAQAFAAARRSQQPIGVLYMDLDGFKTTIDVKGRILVDLNSPTGTTATATAVATAPTNPTTPTTPTNPTTVASP